MNKLGLLKILEKSIPHDQAVNELRWIRQELMPDQWRKAVIERSQLRPLQYILGNQPFGDLTIKCKESVLIPRWETEEWTLHLSECLQGLHIHNLLDYCTGTGCIALALAEHLQLDTVVGADINPRAVELSRENATQYKGKNNGVYFEQLNLSKGELPKQCESFELLVSNPPYIPESEMNPSAGTEKSVLMYEPRSALVGDLEFYDYLTNIIGKIDAQAFVFELGYRKQATEVKNRLPIGWKCGVRYDSANNIRNVIGWKSPKFDVLKAMVDTRL